MEFLMEPWPWYIGGPMIAIVLYLLHYFGKKFGVSSNLETICAIGGAGKLVDFFNFDWRKSGWNLMFIVGSVIGGFIAYKFMTPSEAVMLNPQTVQDLAEVGFQNAGAKYLPDEIFGTENLMSLKGMAVLLLSGVLVGFGARYAGGCTSGHAISGLSNLEMPSLISVIGFFIGGLIMTWLLIPLIF